MIQMMCVPCMCGLRAERRASRPDAESVHCAACAGGRGGGCSLADAVCHRCPLSALRGSRSGDGCMDGCARRVARGPWGVGVHTRSRPQRRRAAHPCPVPRPPVLAPTPAGGAYRMVCIRSVYVYSFTEALVSSRPSTHETLRTVNVYGCSVCATVRLGV